MDGVEYDPNEEQADDDEEFVPEATGMATRGEATKAPVAPVIRRVPSHVEPEIAEARRTQKEKDWPSSRSLGVSTAAPEIKEKSASTTSWPSPRSSRTSWRRIRI